LYKSLKGEVGYVLIKTKAPGKLGYKANLQGLAHSLLRDPGDSTISRLFLSLELESIGKWKKGKDISRDLSIMTRSEKRTILNF